jgi:large subunit ribosomal protein L9
MKVILNKDLASLGEEGDVKDVAKGYARNYLFPRGIALPYTEKAIKLFEGRKGEIEARKALKRQDAAGLKERIEALSIVITMPAGANGKLYGAVTSQTIMEELAKQGFQVERKRIELPGNSLKSVGKYKVMVKLYENAQAECTITVEGQAIKSSSETSAQKGRRKRQETGENKAGQETGENKAGQEAAENKAGQETAENKAGQETRENTAVSEEASEPREEPKTTAEVPKTAELPKTGEVTEASETAENPGEVKESGDESVSD